MLFFRTSGNVESVQQDEENFEHLDQLEDQVDDISYSQPSTSRPLKKKKENVTPFQHSLLQALNTVEEVDADKQFLLSFLPGIKKLTEDQKMEFKFEFHQMYRNFIRGISTVPESTQIHINNSNSTDISKNSYQMQPQYFSQNILTNPFQSIGQQGNYRSPTPQPFSSSSSSYISQQPYPSPSHISSFSTFPLQQPYQPSTFISTPTNRSAPYASVPITQSNSYDNNDTIGSI